MEEKRLTRRFSDLFDEIVPVVENLRKGFFAQNAALVKESHDKFKEILRNRVAFAEKILKEKVKGEQEQRYVLLIVPFQTVALAMENLMEKMEIKVDAKILFSEKALKEINALFAVIEAQLKDTKDYVLTANPHLKAAVHQGMEDIQRMADEYAVIHQDRLIAGVCMPKASYLYIDITDSLKRLARGLAAFSERV
jgi:Na+/phosphate symporter